MRSPPTAPPTPRRPRPPADPHLRTVQRQEPVAVDQQPADRPAEPDDREQPPAPQQAERRPAKMRDSLKMPGRRLDAPGAQEREPVGRDLRPEGGPQAEPDGHPGI